MSFPMVHFPNYCHWVILPDHPLFNCIQTCTIYLGLFPVAMKSSYHKIIWCRRLEITSLNSHVALKFEKFQSDHATIAYILWLIYFDIFLWPDRRWWGWSTHWGRDKMDAISQTILSNAFSWMKMSEYRLKFHRSLFLRVQLTISQHWFR